jgi:hypothetical protein
MGETLVSLQVTDVSFELSYLRMNINIQLGDKSLEPVEQFKYLGTTLKRKNSSHEEMKSRLKPGNACYRSVQNFFFQFTIRKYRD